MAARSAVTHALRIGGQSARPHCARALVNPWYDAIRKLDTAAATGPVVEEKLPAAAAAAIPLIGRKRTVNINKADAKSIVSKHHKISFDDKKILVPWDEGKTKLQSTYMDERPLSVRSMYPSRDKATAVGYLLDIKPAGINAEDEGLRIEWQNDGHETFYPWEWLHRHSYAPRLEKYLSPQFKYWGKEIIEDPPVVKYDAVMSSEQGVAEWTSKIETHGFCFVDGVPVNPEETEKLVLRIGHIRHTHYGGFWDFTSDLSKKDTAYTTLALGAHTDTTYFSEPAGLQLFHLLDFHSGSGGESLLVDGFRAARILREEKPESYSTLSSVRIPSHASGNEGISIEPYAPFPVLNHHPVNGELVQVRWNNDDRATMDRFQEIEDVEKFYEAISDWDDILKRDSSEYWEQLKPGRALIFDNWRVLHGRAAFSGYRRMCGAYVARDDYYSRLRMSNYGREEILKGL